MSEQSMTPATEAQIDGEPQTPDGPSDDTGEFKGGREARYRIRAREAEAERDALAARLSELQTAELHRQAGELLAVADDIELSGKALADYLTPEGWVDREAVAAAAELVIAARPGLAKNPRVAATDPSQGTGSNSPGNGLPTFGDLFKS